MTDSVRVIEADAFFQCSKLSNVTFVEDAVVKSLDSRSLGGLAFREVTLPRSVEAVGNGVMAESQLLETIYVYKEFPLDKYRDALLEGTTAVVEVIDDDTGSSNAAVIAGGVIGGLALAVLLTFVVYVLVKRRRTKVDAKLSTRSLLESVNED